jgi:hypothetical protein
VGIPTPTLQLHSILEPNPTSKIRFGERTSPTIHAFLHLFALFTLNDILSNMPDSTVEETKKTLVQRFRAWGGTSSAHSALSDPRTQQCASKALIKLRGAEQS